MANTDRADRAKARKAEMTNLTDKITEKVSDIIVFDKSSKEDFRIAMHTILKAYIDETFNLKDFYDTLKPINDPETCYDMILNTAEKIDKQSNKSGKTQREIGEN